MKDNFLLQSTWLVWSTHVHRYVPTGSSFLEPLNTYVIRLLRHFALCDAHAPADSTVANKQVFCGAEWILVKAYAAACTKMRKRRESFLCALKNYYLFLIKCDNK
jgi:hypothetical protein